MMFSLRLLVSLFELLLMIVMAAVIITVIYRVFIRANPDFDMEEEIRRGNPAVGSLMATIILSAGMLLKKGLGASVGTLRLALATPEGVGAPLWQAALLILGHLTVSLAVAVVTISFTLRLFGRMTLRHNPGMCLRTHLKDGNLAVGLLLSGVVFIAALYVGDGVSALTKALVPQPSVGRLQIME